MYAVDGLIVVYITHLTTRRRHTLDQANRRPAAVEHARRSEPPPTRTKSSSSRPTRTFSRTSTPVSPTSTRRRAGFSDTTATSCSERRSSTSFPPRRRAARGHPPRFARAGRDHTERVEAEAEGRHPRARRSEREHSPGRPMAGVRSRHQRAQAHRGSAAGVRVAARQLRRTSSASPIRRGSRSTSMPPGRRMIGLAPDFPVEQLKIQDCYPPEIRPFVTDVILKTMVERGQWSGETEFQNFETHAKDSGLGYPLPDSRREWRAHPGHRHGHARHLRSAADRRRA